MDVTRRINEERSFQLQGPSHKVGGLRREEQPPEEY
jgi:hypothetical protein